MGRRRTGHVIERAADRWEAWVAGEYLGTLPSEAEAWSIIREWLATEEGASSDRFNAFGRAWITKRETDGRIKGIRQELSAWDAHVAKAHWFTWPMRRITPGVLQAWVGGLFRTPRVQVLRTREGIVRREVPDEFLSRKSVANILAIVSRCFDYALVDGKVKSNPASAVILPPEELPEEDDDESSQLIPHLTAEQIKAVFTLGLAPMVRAAYSVAIYGGLSKDELWGLRWQDLTFDKRDPFFRIRKGYNTTLKAKRRRRDIPMLPPARAALLAYQASITPTPIGGLVFPADGGGCHHRSYSAGWRDQPMNVPGDGGGKIRIVRPGHRSAAGLPDSQSPFHVLRHTCGSHLLQGTWTPRYLPRALTMQQVSKWLGHSSVTVTERHYAEFSDASLRRIARLDDDRAESEAAGEAD